MMLQMYGAGDGGTDNAVASVDVPQDGHILGCFWAMYSDLKADGDFATAVVSFGTTYMGSNDCRSNVSLVTSKVNMTTSGAPAPAVNVHHPMKLKVFAGERLYLHINATASKVTNAWASLEFDFEIGRSSSRRG